MQLVITEKQLRELSLQITANQAVTEEDGDAAAAAPEAGTSSDGDNKTGASKWESGVTRGPGNQIGVTKWSDVVGSSLKRGKANPLGEQIFLTPAINPVSVNNALNPATDTPTEEKTAFWGGKIPIPTDGSVTYKLWSADETRSLSFKGAFKDGDFVFWPQEYKDPKTGEVSTENELAPDEGWLNTKFPTGTIKQIKITDGNKFYGIVLTKSSQQTGWKLTNNYLHNNGSKYIPYKPEDYIHISFTTNALKFLKENWATIGEVVLSIAAGILTGGASLLVQALVQAGVTLAFAGTVYALSDQTSADTVGLVTGIMIGCLPFISYATKLGLKGPLKGLAKYGDELVLAKNEDEILEIIGKFDETEQIMISRCLKEIPKAEFEKVIKSNLVRGFREKVVKKEIQLAKIPGSQLKWWKELLVEGGGAIPIAVGGFAYTSVEERKKDEEALNRIISGYNNQNSNKSDSTQQVAKKVTSNKFGPGNPKQ